jgi:hypothetical protein
MKSLFILVLILSIGHGFNFEKCTEDIEHLAESFLNAVVDWNMIFYYRQAIQEMGYSLQALGMALIDCNVFSLLFLEKSVLDIVAEDLINYSGPVDQFTPFSTEVTARDCDTKLKFIHEAAAVAKESQQSIQKLMESIYDFMSTCDVKIR